MYILQQLKEDHVNVSTLLDVLENQIDHVRHTEKADFDLMRDIMHYMSAYADGFHHPIEDLMIEKLVERDPAYRDEALTLVKEHADLAKKSKAFHDMLMKVIDGEIVLRKDIVARGMVYIGFLRSHMQREVDHLFPRAEATLKEMDWKRISDAFEHRRDPVFGEIVDAQFKSIYRFIQLQSQH